MTSNSTNHSAMVGDLTILGDRFRDYPFKTTSDNEGHRANIHKIVMISHLLYYNLVQHARFFSLNFL